jgi:integral membrane protein
MLSWLEGISLLLLLGVAMPLKYLFALPLAVRIVGSVHGILFLALLSSALQNSLERNVPKGLALRVVALSLFPLGFLLVDRALREQQTAAARD